MQGKPPELFRHAVLVSRWPFFVLAGSCVIFRRIAGGKFNRFNF
jgi:hypothetical protein